MLQIDLTPINEFKYCQISNHDFQYLLLDENNRALHSPYMCKDYLQDMFWCEYTGNPSDIWGIHWKPGMMNKDAAKFRLAILGGGEKLQNHMEELKEFLNIFESALGIPPSEVYDTDNPEIIVIEFDKEWTRNGPLLSAFTTLIRLAGDFQRGEDALSYLKRVLATREKNNSKLPAYMNPDIKRLDRSIGRLAALLQGKAPEYSWNDIKNVSSAHDTGLLGFKTFPTVEV